MTYVIETPRAGLHPIAVTDAGVVRGSTTYPLYALGTIVKASDVAYGGGEFIYLKGIANTVIGSVVTYDEYLGTTALCPATGGIGMVAVAMAATTVNLYGWYQIQGTAVVKAPNSVAVGAEVFCLAATPGSVDDAAVNGEQILNAKFSTDTGTPSTGFALAQINRPFLQGQTT